MTTEVLPIMAVFQCKSCGATKEGRCKPQKCECGAKGEFVKLELTPEKK